MKTTFKKTVSALLAVLMIVCILPVSSLAGATNIQISTLKKALSDFESSGETKLYTVTDDGTNNVNITDNTSKGFVYNVLVALQPVLEAERNNYNWFTKMRTRVLAITGAKGAAASLLCTLIPCLNNFEYDDTNKACVEISNGYGGVPSPARQLENLGKVSVYVTRALDSIRSDSSIQQGTVFRTVSYSVNTFNQHISESGKKKPWGQWKRCIEWYEFYGAVNVEYSNRVFRGDGRTVPTGYNFERDSYGFENYIDYIPKRYFEKMYCASKGKDLFDFWLRMNFGVCFGMSMTTAAIYNDLPNIQTFAYMDGIKTKTAEKIRDLTKSSILNQGATTMVGDDYLTLTDYIRYAHIFQFSSYSQKNRVLTNGKDLYDLVKSKAQNNQVGIIVEMYNDVDGGGHAVLAVGVDGNNILVDDPNSTKKLKTLTVKDDGSWSFNGLKNYDSAHCRLMYECDYDVPLYWIENIVFNQAVAYTADEAIGCYLDNDKLLFSSYSQNYRFDDKSAQKIENISGNDTKEKNNIGDVFWITQKDSVMIENVKGSDNEFRLAGNENVIYVNVDDSDNVSLKMNEKNKDISVVISTGLGKECSVACELFDGQNYYEIKITGVSGSGTVKSEMTESGMHVSGLNNIQISYKKDDVEIGNATAKVKDGGEVNITVDKDTGNVQTDFVGEKTENACGYCGKVHGTSFKEVLVKFFHKIFYFFAKLFGTIK